MQTKAHSGHRGCGGIQNHSCGPLYPMMIRGVGDTVQAFDGRTGREGVRYAYDLTIPGSFHAAHDKAEADCRQWLDEEANERLAEWFDRVAVAA